MAGRKLDKIQKPAGFRLELKNSAAIFLGAQDICFHSSSSLRFARLLMRLAA
jgi:hypothetical protein